MACPICVGPCTCGLDEATTAPSGEKVSVLIDPEHYDPSEERFAQTLASVPQAPPIGHLDVATELEASARAVQVRDFLTRELSAATNSQAESPSAEPVTSAQGPEWKHEVSTRVTRFRSRRRPRAERPRSLTFNFDPNAGATAAATRKTMPVRAPEGTPATLLLPAADAADLLPAAEVIASAGTGTSELHNQAVLASLTERIPSGWEVLDTMTEGYATQRHWPALKPEVDKPRWRTLSAVREALAQEGLLDEVSTTEASSTAAQFEGTVIDQLTQAVKKFEVRTPTPLPEKKAISETEQPVLATAPAAATKTNIIEFPQTVEPVQEESHQLEMLAEPVVEAPPRIFEAEEIPEPVVAVSAPAVPSVVLDEPLDSEPGAEPQPQMVTAPIALRAYAAALDMLFVGAGVMLFMLVSQLAGAALAGPSFFAATTAAQFLLMGFYQYLFLTRAGATPGMRQFGLELASFDGIPVSRARRQARAFAVMLSSAALGLGFLWSLLDEEKLGWHDRITHTYLAAD
jgi:uncharacterized RDD family membrane protein YckC